MLLFGTIFKHVALLVTEISHQDQIFKIIPHITFWTLRSEKIINCVMLVLIFVHDTHKNLNKCVSCQIFSYFTRYAGLSKALGPLKIAALNSEYLQFVTLFENNVDHEQLQASILKLPKYLLPCCCMRHSH